MTPTDGERALGRRLHYLLALLAQLTLATRPETYCVAMKVSTPVGSRIHKRMH